MTQRAAIACLSLAAKVEETQVPLLLELPSGREATDPTSLGRSIKKLSGPSFWENKGSCNFEAFPKWHTLKLITVWLLLLFIRISYSSKEPDVEGEALTEFFKVLNDSSGHITDWNDHFVSPCFSWSHVTCRNGNVISL